MVWIEIQVGLPPKPTFLSCWEGIFHRGQQMTSSFNSVFMSLTSIPALTVILQALIAFCFLPSLIIAHLSYTAVGYSSRPP